MGGLLVLSSFAKSERRLAQCGESERMPASALLSPKLSDIFWSACFRDSMAVVSESVSRSQEVQGFYFRVRHNYGLLLYLRGVGFETSESSPWNKLILRAAECRPTTAVPAKESCLE